MTSKISYLADRDWLYDQYITKRNSIAAIAKYLNSGTTSIQTALKKHNIETRSLMEAQYSSANAVPYQLMNKDWLYDQYMVQRNSTTVIGKFLGCSSTCISRYLKNYDIKILSNSERKLPNNIFIKISDATWLYDQYVNKKKSCVDIGNELGCSDITINNYLKLANIQIRNTLENVYRNTPEILEKLNDKDWLYDQYVNRKKTCNNISMELGASCSTVYKRLLSNNIDIRHEYSVSSHEIKIQQFLHKNNIEFVASDRNTIAPYELDIFVPTFGIAIEVNGLYWHSELFKSDTTYHENKRKLCEANNIRLIHLYEDDINNNYDIIERFLSNVFMLYNETNIFARKCRILHDIPKSDTKTLLDKYHIQGNAAHNKSIGLEYNNELVAVMIFKGNVLTRYATSKKVIGGFGRLLKATKIHEIITFVDLDMFTGDTYFKVGFEIDSYITPDYKYVVGAKRIHKFNYRKKRFMSDESLYYEPDLTEHQLAIKNKIYRIYDSGKYRLKYYSGSV